MTSTTPHHIFITKDEENRPEPVVRPPLSAFYPCQASGRELRVLVQPERQYRARYLTEGSRGPVRDASQNGYPTVELLGHGRPVLLDVFVGSDCERVQPHPAYQACCVTGRGVISCKESSVEGTTLLNFPLLPEHLMTTVLDCVGILKLRNADVEMRLGGAPTCRASLRVRLVFRTHLPRANGSFFTLQTMSAPITCTQPARAPEILRKSLHSSLTPGGSELFLFGRNFFKGTRVIFQEVGKGGEMLWQAEAPIDKEFFHQNHMVVRVPPYHEGCISTPIFVSIIILSPAGQYRDHQGFSYLPCTGVEHRAAFLPNSSPKRQHSAMELMSQTGLQSDRTIPKDYSNDQHDHGGAVYWDFLSPSWKAQPLRCYQQMKSNSVEANCLKPFNIVKVPHQPKHSHLPRSPSCNHTKSNLGLTFPVGSRSKHTRSKQGKYADLTPQTDILETSQRSPHLVDCVTQVFEQKEDLFPTQILPLPSHTQAENAASTDQTTEALSNVRLPAFNSVKLYDSSTPPNVPVPGHGFSEPTPHLSIVHNSPYSSGDLHFLSPHWNMTSSVYSHPDPEETFEAASSCQGDVQSGLPENKSKEVRAPLHTQPPLGFYPAFASTVLETLQYAAERSNQITQHVEKELDNDKLPQNYSFFKSA
uniref:uncharacterized protein n=1 Tax=Myxine glutinosa TaxID=7769 RepID=UPI00358E61AF